MSIKFIKPNGKIVCLNEHTLPNGDIQCSYHGQIVTKECCEECKQHKESIEMPKIRRCPSKKACPFKLFDIVEGMTCTLTELPEHISAICSRSWEINVLKKVEE